MNIFMFPFGGGSAASFKSYADQYPLAEARVRPIELPGRGRRSNEPFAGHVAECALRCLDQIDFLDGPYVIHGHCMGALLAYDTCDLICKINAPRPEFLVVSARNSPIDINEWLEKVPDMTDSELFERMAEMGGIPRGLSFAMARPFLNIIRNDQAMCQHYTPPVDRIDIPILVMFSEIDSMTTVSGVNRWREFTTKEIQCETIDGSHYFIFENRDRVANSILEFSRTIEI
jgi:surfactin synthase thioesterase subunit